MARRNGTRLAMLALAIVAWTGAVRAQAQGGNQGSVDRLQEVQDMGRVLFKMADDNNDGQISQKEAIDAGNGLVGGAFFRADTNGDGTVSQEEARAAREAFLKDRPWVRYIVETTRTAQSQPGQATNSPNAAASLRGIMSAIDTNNDKQLQASEVRQAVQTTVQGVFATADTNRDGQLSPTEVNAAMAGAAKALAQAAFQQADADQNGTLSESEFDKAIMRPAHVMFMVMDLNHDGQISQEELQRARRTLMSQVRMLSVPEPPNSPRNLIQSRRAPSEVAPVPNIRINPPQRNEPANNQPPAPNTTQPAAPTTTPAQP